MFTTPDFTKQFVIQKDESSTKIGVPLTQNGHPVSFSSKMVCPKLGNSSTLSTRSTCYYHRSTEVATMFIRKAIYYQNRSIILKELLNSGGTNT